MIPVRRLVIAGIERWLVHLESAGLRLFAEDGALLERGIEEEARRYCR